MNTIHKRLHGTILSIGIFLTLLVSVDTVNAGPLGFTVIGTHPQAQAQSSADGRSLQDLMVKGNLLYAGYGDWQLNTGPVALHPFNMDTQSFSGSWLTVPTESIDVIRKINGDIYAPMTDPRTDWLLPDSGFATDRSGSLENITGITAVHIFDMTTLDGSDLWAVGSRMNEDGDASYATAWRSTDNGATWHIAQEDTPTIMTGAYIRYHWIATLNGKIYTRTTSLTHPMRVFDGSNWSTLTTNFCSTTPRLVEVFAGKIICRNTIFDGVQANTVTTFPDYAVGKTIQDFYVSGSYLYVLAGDIIYRTTDFQDTWQLLGDAPAGAQSIAVYDDHLYIGDAQSQILMSSVLLSSFSELTPPSQDTGEDDEASPNQEFPSSPQPANIISTLTNKLVNTLTHLAQSGSNTWKILIAAGLLIASSIVYWLSLRGTFKKFKGFSPRKTKDPNHK